MLSRGKKLTIEFGTLGYLKTNCEMWNVNGWKSRMKIGIYSLSKFRYFNFTTFTNNRLTGTTILEEIHGIPTSTT